MNLKKTMLYKMIENFNEGGSTSSTVSKFCKGEGIDSDEVCEAIAEFYDLASMDRRDFKIINPESEVC